MKRILFSFAVDVVGLMGGGLTGYGLWLVYPPLVWICGGLALLIPAVMVTYSILIKERIK